MTQVIPGRFTADNDQPFVVFMIGMRVNRLLAFSSWLPVFKQMPPMLTELYTNKEIGFLGGEYFYSWRGITHVQYWRSYEQLMAYSRGELHMEAWKRFYEKARNNQNVGIWHETYVIEPGKSHSFYGNMPVYGLAKATAHREIKGGK